MIVELCDIRVHPGQNAAFEEAIQRGIATGAARAKGFQGCNVNRGIESPSATSCRSFGTSWKTTSWLSGKGRCFSSGVPSSAPSPSSRPLWSTLR
jgi:hypothetical protein